MINIFVGYDPKESVAYHVCTNSIIRTSSSLISIKPLALNLISSYKETHTDGSNDFTYTRFLVPYLMNYTGWAIFIDGDMILKNDITELWNMRDESKAVMVVKHDYKTKLNKKYFNSYNENYPRKNWSSVILWNCKHPANLAITSSFVENATGEYLHRFKWLEDHLIGELPIEWNWLPDELGENTDAKLLHYTLGIPCFKEFEDTPQSNEWRSEYNLTTYFYQNPTSS
jgi:lipopolysaccharide biosynthesis glycosyltransferase